MSSGWVNLLVCEGTGQIMTHESLLRHYNLDPAIHRKMAALQQVHPGFFSASGYGPDSDAEDHGEERRQPEIDAILANIQPGCNRYFQTPCHRVLQWLCEPFCLRYLLAVWKDHAEQESWNRYEAALARHRLRLRLETQPSTASDILEHD